MPLKAVLPNNLKMTNYTSNCIDWDCLLISYVWGAIFIEIKNEAPGVKKINFFSMQNLCSY